MAVFGHHSDIKLILEKFCRYSSSHGVGYQMSLTQAWHRRQALLLASQLPDNVEDARKIAEACLELVGTFLERGEELENHPQLDNVVHLHSG
jgi:Uma2 family endonuclease